MNVHVSTTAGVGNRLMYMFGSFKPSEREHLLDAASNNFLQFTQALSVFLDRWAHASWLEEYNVERVGEWIGAKCPDNAIEEARSLAHSKLASTENAGSDSVFVMTYQSLLTGLDRTVN